MSTITIKEIARRTGLSIPTVGNVLGRAAHRYSAETQKRVRRAAEEMGYKPNTSARAMRSGRFGCAALVLSRSKQATHSYIPPRLIDGLDNALGQHNMHLTVSRLTDEELSTTDFIPKVLREHVADGMIVNYTHEIPATMLELIRSHHTPAVWLNAKLDADCVYPDDFTGARNSTDEILKLGHQRVALVHLVAPQWPGSFEQSWPHMHHYSAPDRAAGYAAAMAAAGFPTRVLSHKRYITEAERMTACRELLAAPDRPTAVLAYSEGEAHSILDAALSLGLSIPRDLSIVVFAPESFYAAGHRVTTAAVPTEQVGAKAVDMLLKKLAFPDQCCDPQAVAYGLSEDRQTLVPVEAN